MAGFSARKTIMAHQHHGKDFIGYCRERLKEAGNRVTQPRMAVVECLAQANTPLSPVQVFDKVSKTRKDLRVDKVTVYRVLETLHQLDLVHQVGPDGLFIACRHPGCNVSFHVMTSCQNCGQTTEHDVPEGVVAPLQWYLVERMKFLPREHFFQVNGCCASCAKKEAV
jgi:Fur family ferric uptake transcriptional regulator